MTSDVVTSGGEEYRKDHIKAVEHRVNPKKMSLSAKQRVARRWEKSPRNRMNWSSSVPQMNATNRKRKNPLQRRLKVFAKKSANHLTWPAYLHLIEDNAREDFLCLCTHGPSTPALCTTRVIRRMQVNMSLLRRCLNASMDRSQQSSSSHTIIDLLVNSGIWTLSRASLQSKQVLRTMNSWSHENSLDLA